MSIHWRRLVVVLLAFVPPTARGSDGPGFAVPDVPDPIPGVDPAVRVLAPLEIPSPLSREQRPDGEPLRASITSTGLLGSLTSKQTVQDGDSGVLWDSPLIKRGWQSDQSWRMDLAGPVFAFGQTTAAAADALQQDAQLNGRTGLGCQLPLPIGELLLKGGSNTTYSDALRASQAKERSELLLQVQARCPLLFGVSLEFDGTASPALTPLERDWISQEVRLALPVSSNCKLKLGARQRWDNLAEQRTTTEGTELFLGVELKH